MKENCGDFIHRNRKSALESSRLIRPRSQPTAAIPNLNRSDFATATSGRNIPETNDTLEIKDVLHTDSMDKNTDDPVPQRGPSRIDPMDVELLLMDMEQDLWIRKDTIQSAAIYDNESRDDSKTEHNDEDNSSNWDDFYCEPVVDQDEDADIRSISEDIQSITEEIKYDEKWNNTADEDQEYIMPPRLTHTTSTEEDGTLESTSSEALALDDMDIYSVVYFLVCFFLCLASLRLAGRNTTTLIDSHEPMLDPRLALRLLE